jgi:putative copper export protein
LPAGLPLFLALARGIHMAANFSLFGTLGLSAVLLPPGRIRGIALLAWASFLVLSLTGSAWFILQAADMSGARDWDDVWTALPIVAGSTRFGTLLIGRLAAAALAILLFQCGFKRWAALAAGAAVAAEAWLDHGGAMAGGVGNILLVSAIIHLVCGGTWLGALPALRLALGRLPLAEAAHLAARFSPIGIACVAGMMVSAVVQYIYLIGSPAALFQSAYGLTVAFKILLLAFLVALAAVNRTLFTPQLAAGQQLARARLLRSVSAEIALGLCALLAAGWLLQLTPPTMALMLNNP